MKSDRSVRAWILRSLFLMMGLFIMAFGVSFSIKAGLGTSPISSLPYAVSCITSMTVGTATIIMHITMILLQILLLRKNFPWIQLLQLPVAFAFGYLCDAALYLIRTVNCSGYLSQWICCVIGIILLSVGVSIEVCADVTTLAGEGTVLALCKVTKIKFGTMKVAFDVTLVVMAVAVSLIFLGTVTGVREGTVAAAIFVGMLSRKINIPMGKLVARLDG